jgi:hypothetical protein
MIMKAFLSGQIAQSIYLEENRLIIINAKDPGLILECTPYDYSLFFNSGAEIRVFENISKEQLQANLILEKANFDALQSAIGGMDKNLSEETRILSIQHAEKLIENQGVSDFVKSRLFGNPIPEDADIKGALKFSKRNNLQGMILIYGMLVENKDVLGRIARIFKKTIFRLSLVNDFSKINNFFITTGLYARLFVCISAKNIKELIKIIKIKFLYCRKFCQE